MNKVKLSVGLSLIIFIVTVSSVVVAGFLTYGISTNSKTPNNKSNTALSNLNKEAIHAGPVILTEDVVRQHNSPDDCWMIISGNVYNFTDFISQHPGGAAPMLPYCGKDGTKAFSTKDKSPVRSHTSNAQGMLSAYLVGPLGKALTTLQQDKLVSKTTTNSTNSKTLAKLLTPTPTPIINNGTGVINSSISLTTSEIATHNTIQNCWLIISGKVYNVTNYIYQHPGGVNAISPYCGKEATTAFQTKGGNGSNHSSNGYNLLNQYLIGSVGASVAAGSSAAIAVVTTTTPTLTPTLAPVVVPASNLVLTTSEIATHNTIQNCWLIISGKVYNVTNYIYQHPGGVNAISPYCGKEATTAFQTKGGRGSNHSNTGYNLLAQYLIGTVGSSVPVSVPTATVTPSSGGAGGGATGGLTSTPTPTRMQSSGGTLPVGVAAVYPGATIKSQDIGDNGSQELEIIYNGVCHHIKTNSSGAIIADNAC